MFWMNKVKCAEKKRLACLTPNVMAIRDIMWHTRKLESLNGSLHGLLYALCSKRLMFYQHHFCWFLIQICHPHQCARHTHLSDVAVDIQTFCFRQLFVRYLTVWRWRPIYGSYSIANLQTLHFIYLFNKYRYWIF